MFFLLILLDYRRIRIQRPKNIRILWIRIRNTAPDSVSDTDWNLIQLSVDPEPGGAKMSHKNRKKIKNFMF
jgi:hypothetical protein